MISHAEAAAYNPSVFGLSTDELNLYHSGAFFAAGWAQLRARAFEDAAVSFARAVTALPAGTPAGAVYNNLGLARLRAGDLAGAVDAYEMALREKPDHADTRFAAAVAFLQAEDLARGWPLFESRHHKRGALPAPALTAPRLTSLPRVGQRVLLWTDQGLGDEVLFASLIPDLIATGAVLTLQCSQRLVPLMQRSFPTVDVGRWDVAALNARGFDAQIALADCSRWLRPDLSSFPGATYLRADRPLTAALRRRYLEQGSGRPLVGISWRTGAPKFTTEKSAPLAAWSPVLEAATCFVSLQYTATAAELEAARAATGATILADDRVCALSDLDTLAAQIAAMDLVVTTSNVTAHVAGALGVPTIVLVPKGMGQFWHWFADRGDSPWYGSACVLRQARRGCWDVPLATAGAMVRSLESDSGSLRSLMRGGG